MEIGANIPGGGSGVFGDGGVNRMFGGSEFLYSLWEEI